MAQITDTQLTHMLREIARAEATRYYKAEDTPSQLLVRTVFLLIVAAATIAFIRAGVDDERLGTLNGMVEEITQEMQAVGWRFEGIADPF